MRMSEMLGNQYFLNGQYEKALTQYAEVLAQNPENKAVLIHTILAEVQLGFLEQALGHFSQLLSLESDEIAPENAYLEPVCHDLSQGAKAQFGKMQNELSRAILDFLCSKKEEAKELFGKYVTDLRWEKLVRPILNKMEKLGQNAKI